MPSHASGGLQAAGEGLNLLLLTHFAVDRRPLQLPDQLSSWRQLHQRPPYQTPRYHESSGHLELLSSLLVT